MLDFTDAPYEFFPARPSSLIMWLSRQANRFGILPGPNHRVREFEVEGNVDALREISRRGDRILFIPNHSTHSDPQITTELQRRIAQPSCYMAAYDVFLRGKLQAWVMQRNGAFSVDREGSDRKAMSAAIGVLTAGEHALTIFPEGNVYMMNDRVTPFLDGASFIALKAQKDLGTEKPIHIVPVSIKLTHLENVRAKVRGKLDEIAGAVGLEFDHGADAIDELQQVGRQLLAKHLRQRGYLSREEEIGGSHLFEDVAAAAERIISGLEEKIDLSPKEQDSPVDRVRRIRGAIHQIRIDPEKEIDHRVAASWADEAILALRVLGYANPYVSEHPSLDRFAETVEKLGEDLYSRWDRPIGNRRAIVRIGQPINIAERLEAFAKKARGAVDRLTTDMESAVQEGLDAINAGNQSEGVSPFSAAA